MANVTDINDKIYDAARGRRACPSAELAREMTAHYVADTDRLGLGRPDHEPLASRDVEPDRRPDRGADRARPRLRGGRRRLLPRALARRLRLAVAPRRRRDGPGRGRRGRRPQGGPARLRALEGAARRARTPPGTRRGAAAGRAGTSSARRWPRSCSAWTSRSTAAASTSSSRTTRTRRRRRWPARGGRSRGMWMHNGMLQLGRREDGQVGRQHPRLGEALDEVGPRRAGPVLRRRPLPPADRVLRRAAGGRRRAGVRRIREAGRRLAPGDSPEELAPLRDAFFDALADDFNTAEALAALYEWVREANRREGAVGDAHLREMLGVLGLENLLDADEAAAAGGASSWPRGARRRARPKDFAEADRLRDELRAAGWEVRDGPQGRSSSRRLTARSRRQPRGAASRPRRPPATRRAPVAAPAGGGAPRCRLRPQPRARGAARAAARCSGSGRREAAREAWLAGRVPVATADEIAARCGHRRPPGHLRRGRPVPVRRRRRAARRARPAASSRSTRSPTRRTSARSAGRPRRGRHRRRDPRAALGRGDARGLQGVGGAVEHLPVARVRNLADFLAEAKEAGCWCYGAAAGARTPLRRPGLPRRGRPGARGGGEGAAPARRRRVRRARRAAAARARRIAQRERRRRGAAVRDLAADGLTRPHKRAHRSRHINVELEG